MAAHAMHTTDTIACHIVAGTSNLPDAKYLELREAFKEVSIVGSGHELRGVSGLLDSRHARCEQAWPARSLAEWTSGLTWMARFL